LENDKLKKITSLCKRRGFIYPNSEIYGGIANAYDYGPLGVELLRNVKNDWWHNFVTKRDEIYGMDGGIISSPKVWEASGHTTSFDDPLSECSKCKKRFRSDMIKDQAKCPECGGKLLKPRKFNLLFESHLGSVEESKSTIYLRGETAQNMFVNFNAIIDSFHPKLPFGLAQIGKAFRNEVTLGPFIFRTFEFEQMEIEYFVREENWEKHFEEWKKTMWDWVVDLGVDEKNLKWRAHSKDELSHYSKRTEDIDYNFPFGGFKELYGLAYRTDYDLKQHAEHSGVDMSYKDNSKKFFPHVVEPTFGVNRTVLVLLLEAYREDEKRTYLKLNPKIAPYKLAVFPLVANKPELVKKAREVYESVSGCYHSAWDDIGNIGKRYRRQDEIGTPWCVTIDYDTLKDDTVTIRDRDTMEQERIKVSKISQYVFEKLTS
jgi:glycyl-tRNA synthetase